ncbi:MAG: flagellar biosynthetic protein FliQ [Alphaproteobacteria bacterium]|nr:flagellar biosynthetic protein FliQ [Alphaproteobacteria bacterium]
MSGGEALDLAREATWVLVVMAGPVMIVGLIVGVAIGVLQALTQIQEATLVFVPKILSIFAAVILLLPMMAASMSGLMTMIVQRIISP